MTFLTNKRVVYCTINHKESQNITQGGSELQGQASALLGGAGTRWALSMELLEATSREHRNNHPGAPHGNRE